MPEGRDCSQAAKPIAVLDHLGTLGGRAGSGGPELSVLLEARSGTADSLGLAPGSHRRT